MRNHSTISFLGLWEQIHNPNFKPIEFDRFKAESPTIDLGRYSPQFEEQINEDFTTRTIRYLIALTDEPGVDIERSRQGCGCPSTFLIFSLYISSSANKGNSF